MTNRVQYLPSPPSPRQVVPAYWPLTQLSRHLQAMEAATSEAALSEVVLEAFDELLAGTDLILCEVSQDPRGGPARRSVLGGRGSFRPLAGLCTSCDGKSALAQAIGRAISSGGFVDGPDYSAQVLSRRNGPLLAVAWSGGEDVAGVLGLAGRFLLERLDAVLGRLRKRAGHAPGAVLVAGIVHDLNNLHQVIRLTAEVIRMDTEEVPGVGLMCAEVEHASQSAQELLAELSLLAPAPGGVRADVRRELATHQTMLSTLANGRRLRLHNLEERVEVGLRPLQLERILVNLVKNASLHTQEGASIGVDALVFDELRPLPLRPGVVLPPGQWVRIRVSDEGEGVAPTQVERLLQAGFTTRGSSGGSGLGLAVCRGLVEGIGGLVDMDGELGVGCSVSLFLPTESVANTTRSGIWVVGEGLPEGWPVGMPERRLGAEEAVRVALRPAGPGPAAVVLSQPDPELAARLRRLWPGTEVVDALPDPKEMRVRMEALFAMRTDGGLDSEDSE